MKPFSVVIPQLWKDHWIEQLWFPGFISKQWPPKYGDQSYAALTGTWMAESLATSLWLIEYSNVSPWLSLGESWWDITYRRQTVQSHFYLISMVCLFFTGLRKLWICAVSLNTHWKNFLAGWYKTTNNTNLKVTNIRVEPHLQWTHQECFMPLVTIFIEDFKG